jgi:hypothetical protein
MSGLSYRAHQPGQIPVRQVLSRRQKNMHGRAQGPPLSDSGPGRLDSASWRRSLDHESDGDANEGEKNVAVNPVIKFVPRLNK